MAKMTTGGGHCVACTVVGLHASDDWIRLAFFGTPVAFAVAHSRRLLLKAGIGAAQYIADMGRVRRLPMEELRVALFWLVKSAESRGTGLPWHEKFSCACGANAWRRLQPIAAQRAQLPRLRRRCVCDKHANYKSSFQHKVLRSH